ncbi:ribokinase [Amycolatopsis bartoniae]|uniref:PfkB family carbohydrate kinase n=1 Tax=Amycolatopsis bartoniae TaxID=941986 RepID=UPI001197023D|nr:PfkB family carbohydrate kinase [Amycolatopsis bartoniae]MBB2934416.1 ribokinase [Amycolatopsis bartoniae]TVT02946.1 ribokinase [Amycolatopsis bartoniae]
MSVVVLGQVARDLVLRVPEVSGAGESATVRERLEMLGGKGANQAVALAQLGVDVSLVGVVGDDRTGECLVAQAGSDGIDVSHVVRRSGTETALLVDVLENSGQWRYLEHVPGPTLVSERDVFAASEKIRRARAVLIQLQEPPETALQAARIARTAGVRVILDGAPSGLKTELLACADVLRADRREAEMLAGKEIRSVEDAVAAGRTLVDRGPSLVVLDAAGEGNVFVTRSGHEFLPLPDVEVVDTTGGGDALIAALTFALVTGEPVPVAARMAVAASARTVQHAGGRPQLSRAALSEYV